MTSGNDTVGYEVLRSDLDIVPLHGGNAFVVHDDKGLLSVLMVNKYSFRIYEPVRFKNVTKAKEWIESGSIAEIQENFTELDVGFMKEMIVYRESSDFEKMLFGEE